jgi:rubrerythrin
MKDFNSIEDILEFAINEEENAVNFYSELAEKAKTEDMKRIFIEFAKEEMGHKASLIKIRDEKQFQLKKEVVADLHISDYLVVVEAKPDMTYQEALVIAMKKEKSAFKLYLTLSNKASSEEMKNVFLSLAQEESKHKLRFELEYDEYVLREN